MYKYPLAYQGKISLKLLPYMEIKINGSVTLFQNLVNAL